jgi:leucyl-tRNA---protein transferase
MEEDYKFLDTFKNEVLDYFLARGWYRSLSVGCMFTEENVVINDVRYSVYWIRYNVASMVLSSSQKRLMNMVRSKYSIGYETFALDSELEQLFSQYKQAATFLKTDSLKYIFGCDTDTFNTEVIKIRDKNKLIAAGLFDKGNNSISGVMNLYDPDYKKYSLGKYLVLEKINYCLNTGIQYYYPGNIVPGITKLDYKLFIDKNAIEVYEKETGHWIPYLEWKAHYLSIQKSIDKSNPKRSNIFRGYFQLCFASIKIKR